MRLNLAWMIAVLAVIAHAGAALAQQPQSVTSYLQQGYQIINSAFGGGYLVLILKKDAAVVVCSVTVETGQTAGCQPIK
jgi:hypothetical protein